MDYTTLLPLFIALAFGGLLVLIAAGYTRLVVPRLKGKTPGIDAVLDALTPWFYKAIFAGQSAILWGFEEADTAVLAADRTAVANALYDLLPDTVMVNGAPLPVNLVKRLVTREVFATWIKNVYDEAHAFIIKNETYLKGQVSAFKPLSIPNGTTTTTGGGVTVRQYPVYDAAIANAKG